MKVRKEVCLGQVTEQVDNQIEELEAVYELQ
jgi:hypothetical protein